RPRGRPAKRRDRRGRPAVAADRLCAGDRDPLPRQRARDRARDRRADASPPRADCEGDRREPRARRPRRPPAEPGGRPPVADRATDRMSLFRHELKGELLLYVRSRELAFFTFLLPMIFFLLLASVYGDDRIKSESNVRSATFLEAGMIGYGAIAIAFAGLAIVLVIRRESGILKPLRATA